MVINTKDSPPKRRVPIQSIVGRSAAASDALRLLVLLDEVERQAAIFTDALSEAVDTAIADSASNDVWRHLQGALFAASIVNRLVTTDGQEPRPWPGAGSKADRRGRANDVKVKRVADLKSLLALPTDESATLIDGMRAIRNILEHIDEYLDFALYSDSVTCVSDWYVSDGTLYSSRQEEIGRSGLRAFCPEAGMLLFDFQSLDLFALDLDMHSLRHNAREAKAEVLATVRGQCRFGGGRIVQLRPELMNRLSTWRLDRAKAAAEMAPAVALPGRIRLWMGVDDTTES